ncbi:MAG: energy-coupling factor ABC transporter ATP-binding protein [Oscillospiraceae bacterium]
MITVKCVSFKYPRSDREVIKDLSCSFGRGEVVALTGGNGCGKTTLTKLMTGMLRPESGCVTVGGYDIKDMDLFQIGRRIGYVFQNPNRQLFCQTVYDEIAFGLKNLGLGEKLFACKTEEMLSRFDLARLRASFPGNLSFGEKQRTALAAVLALGTEYLILDEPTSGLDMRGREELGALLRGLADNDGCGVIFVSHERAFIDKYATREEVMSR